MDARKNFATSLVATAPSPPTTGTTLGVTTGEGGRFPAPPFNAVVCPAGANATPANAEVVRITAMSGDSVTAMTRHEEGSSARSIVVGDRIFAGLTQRRWDEVEALLLPTSLVFPVIPGRVVGSPASTTVPAANTWYALAFCLFAATNLTGIEFRNGASPVGNARACIFASDQTTKLVDRTTNVGVSGANARQRIPFDSSTAFVPGLYYMVLSLFNVAAQAFMAPVLGALGGTGTQATTTPTSISSADLTQTSVPVMQPYVI